MDGRRFEEMESLSLNNSVVDCSYLKEPLAYAAFNAIGAPQMRTACTQVTIDGSDYGLYVAVDTQDDRFLRRNWDDHTGNLYDGKYVWYGDRDYVLNFGEQRRPVPAGGDDVGNDDIASISSALAEAWGQPDFYARMGRVIDYEARVAGVGRRTVGWSERRLLPEREQLPGVFRPGGRQTDWIQWDMDYSFLRDDDWGRNWRQPTGNLAYACFADATWATWKAEVERALAIIDEAGLDELHDDLDSLTEDAAEDDLRQGTAMATPRAWRRYTRDWVGNRSETVRWDWGL